MKINWGTGIVIAFVLFISFILFFVIKMNTNKQYEHDLVSKDYYKKELEYQSKLNKANKTKEKGYQLFTEFTSEGIVVEFPQEIDVEKVTGEIIMYRPSNKLLDFKETLQFIDGKVLVPISKLPEGRWNLEVDWQYNNTENYYYKKELNL
ncbi:FixH family protein [Galbibacter mesophilus]|uniref:FixH family protein n=1 Tax=Galbibacter mesophilus TaxID=379069 RepID=UPI00191CB456|nr:FixH family protein [Galbibacter mesophilus]MCM5664211.1 FixH family protein [Galbibacter mesophilus]